MLSRLNSPDARKRKVVKKREDRQNAKKRTTQSPRKLRKVREQEGKTKAELREEMQV